MAASSHPTSYTKQNDGVFLCRYQIMRSCWDADPFNRPPFRKVVERIEQQLSDTTKHVGCIILMILLFTRFKLIQGDNVS